MVWFQCEDCGENLKKPKLPNHFRICSAFKLSCIDCGEIFNKESVQSHNQCMTEAEKYGPKDQGKPSLTGNSKLEKPKKNADVDINVGLSSCPPWFCSLCNTPATSRQTLLLHADGKKHRAKAKAFHADQKQSNQNEVNKDNGQESAITSDKAEPDKTSWIEMDEPKEDRKGGSQLFPEKKSEKRKHDGSRPVSGVESNNACDISSGEVVKADAKEEKRRLKRNKNGEPPDSEFANGQVGHGEALKKKIKWKKLVISTLRSKPDGVLKIKKLQKLVIKELKVSGLTEDEMHLCDAMMKKINSSSRFVIDNKFIRLTSKADKS